MFLCTITCPSEFIVSLDLHDVYLQFPSIGCVVISPVPFARQPLPMESAPVLNFFGPMTMYLNHQARHGIVLESYISDSIQANEDPDIHLQHLDLTLALSINSFGTSTSASPRQLPLMTPVNRCPLQHPPGQDVRSSGLMVKDSTSCADCTQTTSSLTTMATDLRLFAIGTGPHSDGPTSPLSVPVLPQNLHPE